VSARSVKFLFRSPRFAGLYRETFVEFDLQWNGGLSRRYDLRVAVPDEAPPSREYDLILEGDNPQNARIGLRPLKGGRSNPHGPIFWAQETFGQKIERFFNFIFLPPETRTT
jgi:hypothetical protein